MYSSVTSLITQALILVLLPALTHASDPEGTPEWSVESPRPSASTECPASPLTTPASHHACAAPHWSPWRYASHQPWTRKPMCVKTSQYDSPETYCTFVDANFAGGRGIVAITTPRVAKWLATLPAWRDPASIAGFNDLTGGGPFGPPAYEPRVFPLKGVGLVANRTLVRGDRIMQETVPWIFHRGLYAALGDVDRMALQWHAVHMMQPEARKEFLALKGHHGGDLVHDLMRTNSFGQYLGSGVEGIMDENGMGEFHNQVFTRISRFNHDCRPNAHYFFDVSTMTHYVNAIAPISPGDEIVISYTDSEMLSPQRQQAIALSWGFACACSLCRQPAPLVALSDERLTLINQLKNRLNDWTSDPPLAPQERIGQAELLLDLYAQERLWVGQESAFEAAAYAHCVAGDAARTRQWASRAVEALRIMHAPGPGGTLQNGDMWDMMLDPEAHRTWQWSL